MLKTFKSIMNSLEAVVLITTSKEIKNGMFFHFCNQFRRMPKTNLDFIIFVNNEDYNEDLVSSHLVTNVKIFDSIKIVNLNIPAELDIYNITGVPKGGKVPPLGLISGPNMMFFSAIRYCYKFNTILLLETDCYLKNNCFEKAKSYINNLSDFIISGSRYLGNFTQNNTVSNLLSSFNAHLNGVAFYKTGSQDLERIANKAEEYIRSRVKDGDVSVPYDMALTECLLRPKTVHENIANRRLFSKFTTSTFILNFSPHDDVNISFEEIAGMYSDYIILHTKKHYWEAFQ